MKRITFLLVSFTLFGLILSAQNKADNKTYTFLLTGASFASPNNGWFEVGCDLAGATPINRAIGGRSSRTFFTESRWNRVINYLKEIKLDYLNKLTEDDYTQKIIGEPFLCRYTKDFLFFLSYSYNDLDYIKSIINKYHSTLVKLTKHYDNPNYLQIKYFDTNSNLFNKEYLLYYVSLIKNRVQSCHLWSHFLSFFNAVKYPLDS